jgi:hypothetical protein
MNSQMKLLVSLMLCISPFRQESPPQTNQNQNSVVQNPQPFFLNQMPMPAFYFPQSFNGLYHSPVVSEVALESSKTTTERTERQLGDTQLNDTKDNQSDELTEEPPAVSWWQDKDQTGDKHERSQLRNPNGNSDTPTVVRNSLRTFPKTPNEDSSESLKLTTNTAKSFTKKPSKRSRKLNRVKPEAKQLALMLKPFIDDLRANKYRSIEDLRKSFDKHVSKNRDFFELNFWPLVRSSFEEKQGLKFPVSIFENKVATKIAGMKLGKEAPGFLKLDKSKKGKLKIVDVQKVREFVQELAKERSLSHDGSDSLSGFQLGPNFPENFELLKTLYVAENRMFDDKGIRESVLVKLKVYQIVTYEDFRTKAFEVVHYSQVLLSQYATHQDSITDQRFKRIIRSFRLMTNGLRNKILGHFFHRFQQDLPVAHSPKALPSNQQMQSIKSHIKQLIDQLGVPKYARSVFRIIKNAQGLSRVATGGTSETPLPLSVFELMLKDYAIDDSERLFLVGFFQDLAERIGNIESLVFVEDSSALADLRFDYLAFLADVHRNFSIEDFVEFNVVLQRVVTQVGTVLAKAPVNSDESYFDPFVKVYSRIAMEILGHYYFLTRKSKPFLNFAIKFQIPPPHFPHNYHLLYGNQAGSTALESSGLNKRDCDRLQRVISQLSEYLDSPNGLVFTSEDERARLLDLIRVILEDKKSPLLTGKTIGVISGLKKKIEQGPAKVTLEQKSTHSQSAVLSQLVTSFKQRLNSIPGPTEMPKGSFKVTFHILEQSFVLTTLLMELFRELDQQNRSSLLDLAVPFLEMHSFDYLTNQQLQTVYFAADIYTNKYEALFGEEDLERARMLWYVLMGYYSKNCYFELYKTITVKLKAKGLSSMSEEHRLLYLQKAFSNFLFFLIQKQDFDAPKDCSQAARLVLSKKTLTGTAINRAFVLNSFKKILLKIPTGSPKPPPNGHKDSFELSFARNKIGKGFFQTVKDNNDLSWVYLPSTMSSGERLEPPPPPPNERDPGLLIKVLLQLFMMHFPGNNGLPPSFRWKIGLRDMPGEDKDFLMRLLTQYGGDPLKIEQEKGELILLRIRKILDGLGASSSAFKIEIKVKAKTPPGNPPEKPPRVPPYTPPYNPPYKPPRVPPEEPTQKSLRYVSNVIRAFVKTYGEMNDIVFSHKKIRLKVTPKDFQYILGLKRRFGKTPPQMVFKREPSLVSSFTKMLFFIRKEPPSGPPSEPPSITPPEDENSFAFFKRKSLIRYFNDKLRTGCPYPQLLAKRLFKSTPPSLQSGLLFHYNRRKEITPPVIDSLLSSKYAFYDAVLKKFYKTTDYLDLHKDAKRMSARVFFKASSKPAKQYLKRVYTTYAKPELLISKGPILKVNAMIRRVQFKGKLKCKSSCVTKCYIIQGEERVEMTEEEKKKYAAQFDCSEESSELRFMDFNGNYVEDEQYAQVGCGCTCNKKNGGVMVNKSPLINFNFNFESEQDAHNFEDLLAQSQLFQDMQGSHSVDLNKLKELFKASRLNEMVDLKPSFTNFGNPELSVISFNDKSKGTPQNYQVRYANGNSAGSYATPLNIGHEGFDGHGYRVEKESSTISGTGNFNPRDGSMTIPGGFRISKKGNVASVQNTLPNGQKQQVIIKTELAPRITNPSIDPPVFHYKKNQVVGEVLNENQKKNMNLVLETLRNTNSFKTKDYMTPLKLLSNQWSSQGNIDKNKII